MAGRESIDEFLKRYERVRTTRLGTKEIKLSAFDELKNYFLLDQTPGSLGEDLHLILDILHPIYAQENDPQQRFLITHDDVQMKDEGLELILNTINPPRSPPGLREIIKSKLDFIISLYKGEPRKHGLTYGVSHPIGILNAIMRVAERYDIPQHVALTAAIAAPDHDFGEIILNQKVKGLPLSKISVSELFKNSEKELRERMKGYDLIDTAGQFTGDLEKYFRMSVIADIIVTKAREQHWDDYVQETTMSKTIRVVHQEAFGDTPDDATVDTIRAAIMLLKLLDLNYNIRDFDKLIPGQEPVNSLEFRADLIHKSMYFANQITRYMSTSKERPYLPLFVHDLKQALLAGVAEQAKACMGYLLQSGSGSQYFIPENYVQDAPRDVVIFEEHKGFLKARKKPSSEELAKHSWKRFHGTWYAMLNRMWQKQHRKSPESAVETSLDDIPPVDFKNSREAFDYFISRYRMACLMYDDDKLTIQGFAKKKANYAPRPRHQE